MSTKAPPVAREPFIIGDPLIGGFVCGSYRYENASGSSEGSSRLQWYFNNAPIPAPEGTLRDLKVTEAFEGGSLVFAVTPIAASGESGVETRSEAKTATSDFQGISQEESENSFLKQEGNFSFHVPEPGGRRFVSTGGAFGLLDWASQTMFFEGQATWGMPVPPEFLNYFKNNPATRMFTTERDFGALVRNGSSNQLLVWGANMPASHSVKLSDIKTVYSNRWCLAFIYNNPAQGENRIGAIGHRGDGDVISADIQQALYFDIPLAIYATENAFAVRTENGKVYAWGNAAGGGTIPPNVRQQLDSMFVERIIAAAAAFCAIGRNGEIAVWGNPNDGGTLPTAAHLEIIEDGGVNSVIANTTAFCAITRDRRKAISWGKAPEGGTMSATALVVAKKGSILMCKATRWAFCIVSDSGEAEAWGAPQYGGASITGPVRAEIAAAVGEVRAGPRSAKDYVGSRAITVPGKVQVYSNDLSFLLCSQNTDGSTRAVVVWGHHAHGGALTAVQRQRLMDGRIKGVWCTNGAYGVVLAQGPVYGSVMVWGATLAMEDAGEIPPELAQYLTQGVIELYSIKRYPFYEIIPPPNPPHIDPSLVAVCEDGSYVMWGGNVRNQRYVPGQPAKGAGEK
ncbi:hypothetical protein [Pseudomonas sp. Marseille-P9899]|uniref:hypothetical protein n=1 Tax=Pseudomonas sp. Marseille-P9899 TaxID=2730401 RepID=UPI001C4997A9|nr:hypothetical protein [Pseudomonas sp. Marseille-P9899]